MSAAEIQRRAIAGSIWTVIHVVVTLPFAFVANAVVARSLGVSSYGHLAFLTATLTLTFALANFGFNTALIQQGSRAETSGRRSEADDLLRRSLGFQTTVELPIVVVVAAVLTRGDPWWEVVTIGAGVLLTPLVSGAGFSVTMENRTAAAAKFAVVSALVVQGASMAVALATASAPAVWAARTLASALGGGLTVLVLDRERRRTVFRPKLPTGLSKAFWRYALLSWIAGLVALLVFSRSEIFLLEALNKIQAVGLFALAFGLSYQITAPADALLHPLLPAAAGLLSVWPDRALRAFQRSTRVSALLSGLISAIVVPSLVFAIPLLYGHAFKAAAWLFVPLALVSAFQSVNNPVSAFLNARQRGGLILKVTAGALVVDVLLAVLTIPELAAWGAVIASIAGQFVAVGWLAMSEPLAKSGGVAGLFRLYRPFLIGCLAGGVALVVGAACERSSVELAIGVTPFVGCFLYIVAIRMCRSGLTADDSDALVSAVAPPLRPHLSRLLQIMTTANVP